MKTCQAVINKDKTVTFDPFAALDSDGVLNLSRGCDNTGLFATRAYDNKMLACNQHVAVLLHEAESDWDSNLIAVRRLTGESN